MRRQPRRNHLFRNIEIGYLLDTLLVSAIFTILIIRLQLWATHYPKLGGGGLHIAHLLWGGLGMLVAIIILLSFLGRPLHHLAAVIGGVGFGFFIDELGKFITADNNYFFKPAAGIIYLVFIILFLVTRHLEHGGVLTQEECLANAAEMLADAARGEMTVAQRDLALSLLDRCDADHELVDPLKTSLIKVQCAQARSNWWTKATDRAEATYFKLVARPWFSKFLTFVFLGVAVVTVIQAADAVHLIVTHHQQLEVISAAGTISSVIVAALIFRGTYMLRTSRLAAYIAFEHALLVQIFVGEVFAFLETEFSAALGLLLNLALILTLRYTIRLERHLELHPREPGIAGIAPVNIPRGRVELVR
jgi:hypothetical protein